MTSVHLALLAAVSLVAACAPPPAPDARAALDGALIAQAPAPLLLAELPGQGISATLIPEAARDGVVTWRTAGRQTLSFRDGLLIATRGLGDDLMSADVSGTQAALRAGPGSGAGAGYARLMTYLDGEGQTLFRAMTCDLGPSAPQTIASFGRSLPVTFVAETCRGHGLQVENRYWRDPDGTMRRTEQWVGPGMGMIAIEWLTLGQP